MKTIFSVGLLMCMCLAYTLALPNPAGAISEAAPEEKEILVTAEARVVGYNSDKLDPKTILLILSSFGGNEYRSSDDFENASSWADAGRGLSGYGR